MGGEVAVSGAGSFPYQTDKQEGRIALVDIRQRQTAVMEATVREALCAALFDRGFRVVLMVGGQYPRVILGGTVQVGIALAPSSSTSAEQLERALNANDIAAMRAGSVVVISNHRQEEALRVIRVLLRLGEM